MARMDHLRGLRLCSAVFLTFSMMSAGQTINAQDTGAPKWGEFLKRFDKDPLLKPPFHNEAAEAGPKGLASKIRARELDIPNRKKAIRYLADLDCAQFPEAKLMLLEMLNPEKERWEEVRLEAAKGLRDMLERNACGGQCDPEKKKKSERWWKKNGKDEGMCHCTNCCDADTLNTLAKTAYEMKEDGCCYEPSLRVRQMAVEAISVCGVPCNYKPYYAEEVGPTPTEEVGGEGPGTGEDKPPVEKPENAPAPSAELILPELLTTEATPIERLTDICIVELRNGNVVRTNKELTAEYRGRLYFFSSEEARSTFLKSPENYAVAFGGCDPVEFVATKEVVEGRFLLKHDGRYFMFATRENLNLFKENPAAFGGSAEPAGRLASR
ncbi:MAG: YHS domain-containing protein [Planctomyces sp.]|nr:YHS domain-containing protein [Planctomyces sp.]